MEISDEQKQANGGQKLETPPRQPAYERTASDQLGREKPTAVLILAQRYFYYLVFLQVLIVLFLGYWFLLKPKIEQVYKNEAEITLAGQQAQEKIKKYEEAINKYQEFKKSYGNIKAEDVERINNMLPDEEGLRGFLTQIDKIITVNGATLEKVTLNPQSGDQSADSRSRHRAAASPDGQAIEAGSSKISDMTVSFSVKNVSYASFKSLLAGLENNLRLTDVNEVKYNPEERTAEFIAKAYYMK